MTTRVRARYANGVLTPLEPLDLEEGTEVELDIAVSRSRDLDGAIARVKKDLEDIYKLPDDDPKKYKLFVNADDDLIFLEKERKLRDSIG